MSKYNAGVHNNGRMEMEMDKRNINKYITQYVGQSC